MSDLPHVKQGYIQREEVQFKAAVGEYTGKRMGSNENFLLDQAQVLNVFRMNGAVKAFTAHNAVDGMWVVQYDCTILDAITYAVLQGSSGTSSYDIKLSTKWDGVAFGAWTSIFTTVPAFTSASPADLSFGTGSTILGVTAPVLNPAMVTLSQGDRLRMDVISMQLGDPSGHGVQINVRAR